MAATMPEKATQTLLERLGFVVKGWRDRDPLDAANTIYSQYPLESMRIDFVLFNAKIAIEVDGDYWHGRKGSLSLMQMKSRLRDQKKRERLREMEWDLIKVWEREVISNPEKTQMFLNSSILKNLLV